MAEEQPREDPEHKVVRLWDFDKTLSDEYQQMALLRKYEENVRARYPEMKDLSDYLRHFGEYRREGFSEGVNYMSAMLDDIRCGVFSKNGSKLTNQELRELGAQVKLAPGVEEFFASEQEYWKKYGVKVHDFILSVGLLPMMEGSPIAKYMGSKRPKRQGIYACEFLERDGGIVGIKRILSPFDKTRVIIEIAKGKSELLNEQMSHEDYFVDYGQMLYFGDGLSDKSTWRFLLKKGGLTTAFYEPGDHHHFVKMAGEATNWTHYLLPRDFRENSRTVRAIHHAMRRALKGSCPELNPEVLHMYRDNKIWNAKITESVENHLESCKKCKELATLHYIPPS